MNERWRYVSRLPSQSRNSSYERVEAQSAGRDIDVKNFEGVYIDSGSHVDFLIFDVESVFIDATTYHLARSGSKRRASR